MASAARAWLTVRIAGLLMIASLQGYWFLQPVPVSIKVLAFLVIAVSLVRPGAGLLVFAGLAPLSSVIANLCAAPGTGGQLLELMALGIGGGVLLRGRPPEDSTRVGAPMLFMAVVAVASAAVMIPAEAAPVARSLLDGGLIQQLALRQDAQSSPIWAPMFAALVIAECGLLAWAVERTVRQSPQLAGRLVTMGLIGHAGAAVLNLQAMVGGALRTSHVLQALPQMLMKVRVSMQTDWNAGASALLLAGVAGVGLIKTTGRKRAGVLVLLLLVAGGLWTTGSRIALVMGIGAALAAIARSAVQPGKRRLIVAGVALLLLGAGAWVSISSLSGRNTSLPLSTELRWEMAKAGVRMFQEAPVFGIGINKFFNASTAIAGPYLLRVGWRPFENAHNNFIQVLAEQGLAGLGALLWVLAIVLVGGVRAQFTTPSALRGSLILAVMACIGTWLTGHPLLVPEFAFVFWFYCGILAAMTPAVTRPRPSVPNWLPFVLVACGVISIPVRAVALRNAAYLEHQTIGLSVWQYSDSQRFQAAGMSFTLFLPSGGRGAEVPIRRAPGAPDPLVVDITIRGRLVDRVSIGGDAWQTVFVVVGKDARRFEAVDFDVRPPASGAKLPEVLLRVGRTAAR